jgi:putative metallopeptidase DUF4344
VQSHSACSRHTPPTPNRCGLIVSTLLYAAPKTADLNPIHELVTKARVLERVRDLLVPLRLPRRLLLKIEGCDGVSNAWYDGEAVTVCYEFLDEIWKNASATTTPDGVAPIDTLIGPVVDVFQHEVGHAVFDLWKIPVLGREEDAADSFSIYLMLKFPKDEARRLILGNAYQYKGDVQAPTVTMATQKFANEHGTPAQRFFNVLCLAYGADPTLFGDFVANGWLPKDRAEGCEDDYQHVVYAMQKLMGRYVDRKLARKMHSNWHVPPVDKRPPLRPDKP